jgi:hypothetical protein
MTRAPATSMLRAMETNSLITCSVCLRVLHGGEWIDAERAITLLRSFSHPVPPRLESAVCDHCQESIRRRRALAGTLAA